MNYVNITNIVSDNSEKSWRSLKISSLIVSIIALLIYVVLSISLFGTSNDSDHALLGIGSDKYTFIWYLAWWPWAISHGMNPLLSHLAFVPTGYNLAWGTSIPTAALLSLPITLLYGPIVAFNYLMIGAPALSCWCSFLLMRYLTRDVAAALVGGALFGFSSYHLGHLLGHLNLILTFPIPLTVLLVVARVRSDIGRLQFASGLVATLLLLFGSSTEVFASFLALGAIVFMIFMLFEAPTGRRRLFMIGFEILAGNLLVAVILIPFLRTMAAGVAEWPGFVNSPTTYSTDMLNFIIPTGITRFGRTLFQETQARFTGNTSEQGAYIGLPLLLILFLFQRQVQGDRGRRALLLVIAVLMVATLGPVLQIGGWNTGVLLPWELISRLPLLNGALPGRFTLYLSLATAVAASLWLASEAPRLRQTGRYALAAVACVFLLPNPQVTRWDKSPALPFFQPGNVERVLGPGANLLILPYEAAGAGMFWQAQSEFAFSQAGGYFSFVPKPFQTSFVLQLLRGIPDPSFGVGLKLFCDTHQVDAIVLGPGTPVNLGNAVLELGWPVETIGGIQLVRVPRLVVG